MRETKSSLKATSQRLSRLKTQLDQQGSVRCLLMVICVTKCLVGLGRGTRKHSLPCEQKTERRVELHFCRWLIRWARFDLPLSPCETALRPV